MRPVFSFQVLLTFQHSSTLLGLDERVQSCFFQLQLAQIRRLRCCTALAIECNNCDDAFESLLKFDFQQTCVMSSTPFFPVHYNQAVVAAAANGKR